LSLTGSTTELQIKLEIALNSVTTGANRSASRDLKLNTLYSLERVTASTLE
jgi:hypothetical protein